MSKTSAIVWSEIVKRQNEEESFNINSKNDKIKRANFLKKSSEDKLSND